MPGPLPQAHRTSRGPRDTGRPPAPRCRSLAARHLGRALAALLATAASAAGAQATLTLYGGARGGGEFEDANDRSRVYSLDGGASAAASLDWPLADGRQGQLFYSFQRSALPGAALGQPGEVKLNVSHLHLGGRAFFDGSAAAGGGYVVGGLGASLFSPGLSGLSDEWRPSMNLGVGYEWPLAPHIALRTELRGYLSLIDSRGGFFCSGGCVVSIRGNSLTQVEGLLGLSIGF